MHPHGPASAAPDPTAPLFPAMRPHRSRLRATDETGKRIVLSADDALAALSVDEAQARLTAGLGRAPCGTRPSIRRYSVRLCCGRTGSPQSRGAAANTTALPPGLKFHALRHTYASLCVATGIPPLELARFMGHAKVTMTLSVYAHLFEDDRADAMAELGAMASRQHCPGRPTTWCSSGL